MKKLKKHKKYALLWNNHIESLYYSNGEERYIEEEKDGYYLVHDVGKFDINGKLIAIELRKDKIIEESDNELKLERIRKEREDGKEKDSI
jgi:hypothetical protein